MKRESYLKLKKQKRNARLLAILTTLSIFSCTLKDIHNNRPIKPMDEYEPTLNGHIEIVYSDGVLYPTKFDNFKETNFDAFANWSIPVYNSYKNDKVVIDVIPEYQSMNRIYSNEEYSFVITENGTKGYVDNDVITILPDNYVEMDLSSQWVKVIDYNELVLFADVVSGKPGHETNIGYTDIWAKNYNRKLIGPGYSKDVKYFFVFNYDEEGFHDAPWRSEFGGNIYLTNGSLGCGNMREEDIKIMDEHTRVGTKVLIHK